MTPEKVHQALPLVRALRADLTLECWRDFCNRMMSASAHTSGIECAMDENGYLLGLFAYSVRPDFRHRRVMAVDPFVAIDLYGRDLSAQRLLNRIDLLARDLGCDGLHLALAGVGGRLPSDDGPRFAKFENLGYRPEGLKLCKPL